MAALSPIHFFQAYVSLLSSGLYDMVNDDMHVWLTDETPDEINHRGHDPAVPESVNLQQIPFGFGYDGPISISPSTAFPTGGLFELSGQSILIVAVGGAIGPFRFIVLEDADFVVGGAPVVISFWDHLESISILNGGSFEILWEGIQGVGRVLSVST